MIFSVADSSSAKARTRPGPTALLAFFERGETLVDDRRHGLGTRRRRQRGGQKALEGRVGRGFVEGELGEAFRAEADQRIPAQRRRSRHPAVLPCGSPPGRRPNQRVHDYRSERPPAPTQAAVDIALA